MHQGKYVIICKFKYAEIFKNMQKICINMQCNQRYVSFAFIVHLYAKNMRKYAKYVIMNAYAKFAKICTQHIGSQCVEWRKPCGTLVPPDLIHNVLHICGFIFEIIHHEMQLWNS